jgi:hypothetical protein
MRYRPWKDPCSVFCALRQLPFAVLTPQNYRRLVELLDHSDSAKVLQRTRRFIYSSPEELFQKPPLIFELREFALA